MKMKAISNKSAAVYRTRARSVKWGPCGWGRIPSAQHWGGGDRRIPRTHWLASLVGSVTFRFSERSPFQGLRLRWMESTQHVWYTHTYTQTQRHANTTPQTGTQTNNLQIKAKRRKT